MSLLKYKKEFLEFFVLFFIAFVFANIAPKTQVFQWILVIWAIVKTIYFILENSVQLLQATDSDIAYHRFLTIMTYNIGQMIISFSLDFFCVNQLDPNSFSGLNPDFNYFEKGFEFFYFSALNFTFFGYGDLTPATIPSKIILLLEVLIAFLTMIFILSDFISMKDSLKKRG